jgi:gamma-glutamylcyclotransferase (GGCT)/AIG2-like uncharacterized protein YtfP
LLAERGKFIGDAQVLGGLYDLGRYPGARPSSHSILGEVFEIPDSLLAALDEYEGPEFERAIVPTSRNIDCWVYWYVGSNSGRPIPSGDWFQR